MVILAKQMGKDQARIHVVQYYNACHNVEKVWISWFFNLEFFLTFYLHIFQQRTARTVTAVSMINSSYCWSIEKKKTTSVNQPMCPTAREGKKRGQLKSKKQNKKETERFEV